MQANFRVLRKLKSKTADVLQTEFCGLCSKTYSPATLDGKRNYCKPRDVNNVRVEERQARAVGYLRVLRQWKETMCKFCTICSRNHCVTCVTTQKLKKNCLSCLHDKRYILPDVFRSLACRHHMLVRTPLPFGHLHCEIA